MKVICISPVQNIEGALDSLKEIAQVDYRPNISKNDLIKNILGYDAIFVNPNKLGFRIGKEVLKNSNIKVICTASTGTDHIDQDFCKNNKIDILSLTNERNIINKISSTAEHAFALMLSLIRNIPKSFDSVKKYKWDYEPYIGKQLDSLRVGIVGFGRLGKMFAKFCSPFGMHVAICDPDVVSIYENVSLTELFKRCDIITLHIHLNKETYHVINKSILSGGKGVFLINTSRGGVVNEKEVILALKNGCLAGYATDVLEDELSGIKNSPIIKYCNYLNIIITPHVGGATKEAQKIAYCHAAGLLKKYYEEKSRGKD